MSWLCLTTCSYIFYLFKTFECIGFGWAQFSRHKMRKMKCTLYWCLTLNDKQCYQAIMHKLQILTLSVLQENVRFARAPWRYRPTSSDGSAGWTRTDRSGRPPRWQHDLGQQFRISLASTRIKLLCLRINISGFLFQFNTTNCFFFFFNFPCFYEGKLIIHILAGYP